MSDQDTWFPEGYQAPVAESDFYKLEDGDNTFRILSKPGMGYEYWSVDEKPHRQKENWTEVPADIRLDKVGKKTKIKHFWNMLVYNFKTKSIQSFEITQTTIMKALKALIENKAWGSPMGETGYDITINKTGKDLLTKYNVVPNPKAPLTPEIAKALADTEIDLNAIFEESN